MTRFLIAITELIGARPGMFYSIDLDRLIIARPTIQFTILFQERRI